MAKGSRWLPRCAWLVVLHSGACSPGDGPMLATATEGSSTSTGEPSPGSSNTSDDGADVGTSTDGTSTDGTSTDGTSSTDMGASTTGTSSTDMGASTECGDGIVEAGEDCDDAGESARCNADCTIVACGDAWINAAAGEQCEGMDLAGTTCEDLGYVVGTLACTPACTFDLGDCANLPDVPVLGLAFSPIKRFDFGWAPADGAIHYQLEESETLGDPFVQLGGDVVGTSISMTMPLHLRHEASYRLRACNVAGCSDSAPVAVMSSLAEAVGYVKASNTGPTDRFGRSIALSGDGNTLAVGANWEDSDATGIGGNQASNLAQDSGAVYVFTRDAAGTWSQQAYIKASNTAISDEFGHDLTLSHDGNTLAVGAPLEDGNATGIDGDQANDLASNAGAVYVFARDGASAWSQQAYVKASNSGAGDGFGFRVRLSDDGDTLAVGATGEDSNATGANGDQANDLASNAGAVYVFVRDGASAWSQQAYIKASNPGNGDGFGTSMALSGNGNTLAISAEAEDSNATGIDGDQANNLATTAGAVYVFVRDGLGEWSQQAYIKASNTFTNDAFGRDTVISSDGDTLAVSATGEDSNATGIDGDQTNNAALESGAVYVFVRDGMGAWSQQAYVKASNTGANDLFGGRMAMSADGNLLAVGAEEEDGDTIGIGGDQSDESMASAGAVYVLVRSELGTWSHRAYVKASNTELGDAFGTRVAVSSDGHTLAVVAALEDSNAIGIGGNQANNAANGSGAVYLY